MEIPGSVESQISEVLSPSIFQGFGKRGAIMYPQGDRGEAYVNEFWRQSKQKDIFISDVLQYEQNKTDYRAPVKKILGLAYKRERKEEFELLQDVHAQEKKQTIRRIQTLKPQVNFDWIFIPSLPAESLQILPSFSYYDAFNLNIIGGPSWRSQALAKESYKLGKLYFAGDRVERDKTEKFVDSFYDLYQERPRLIEMRAFDAFNILSTVLGDKTMEARDELERELLSTKKLNGLSGTWKLDDQIWLKEMDLLKLHKGKIERAFVSEELPEVQDISN